MVNEIIPMRTAGPRATTTSKVVERMPAGVRTLGFEIGGLTQLAGKTVWSAIREPRGYWKAVRDELYETLKVSWIPIILSVFCFGMFVGILALTFLVVIGAQYQFGPEVLIAYMRDFATWINAMVVAGIVGASITADLGARRIREELDALEVLGVDPVRTLVLPRVVSTTIITGLLAIVSVTVSLFDTAFATNYMGHLSYGDFFSNVFDNVTPVGVVSFVLQGVLNGFIIAIVCSYKGLSTKGGAIGVGRAVNQAVVISFVAIWVLQFVYESVSTALFPALQVAR